MQQQKLLWVIAVALFLATLALYYPALQNGFVSYDDADYVTANFHVRQGLTADSVKWAFLSAAAANWHPLTWMSHMLDVQLFGLRPFGHHAQGILWHAFNVVLLFLLLARATGFVGRSAMVAGLLAVHPLNVESVAWIAERKTVLSAFLLLLTLAAYGWYTKRPRAGRYLLVVLLFALALMAKPMVITLPAALLLLDFWPLERFPVTPFSRLALEKIPLLLLSPISAVITMYAQRAGGAVYTAQLLPFDVRLKNAIYSYLTYLEKAVWPSRLAVFYPHPENSLALWKTLVAAAFLLLVTAWLWRLRRHRVYLVGWLWFLGTMVPMIGIVQVGRQAWADRYAYLPFWGLFVIAVWLASELAVRLSLQGRLTMALGVAFLIAYASVAHVQIGYWRSSYTLFAHAIEVTPPNGIAEDSLGLALLERHRPDLALPHLERAVELIPALSGAHHNLALLWQRQNRLDRALMEYQLALKYVSRDPEAAQIHNNLGMLFQQLGRNDDAVAEYSEAIRLDPYVQGSYLGRGLIEEKRGQLDAAVDDLTRAAQIAPLPITLYWKGRVLEEKGRSSEAAASYAAILHSTGDYEDARTRLEGLQRTLK